MGQWGGARANAGRPARGPIASQPHRRRPELTPTHPVLVVARTLPRLRGRTNAPGATRTNAGSTRTNAPGSTRGRAAWAAVTYAFTRSLARADFRIIAFTVHARRVVLVVEADSALALARGMQGFQVAAARALNRTLARSGTVFADRYHPLPLRTRTAVRAALAGFATRVAFPTTYLLRIELIPHTPLAPRSADPDP
ncbi:MAG: hypothetical protein JO257_34765 [Deltaproteobacteria bacterium]|nr:hypothetical protein [Deltaproteobacteria bacterium]